MKKGFDLSRLNKNSQNFLTRPEEKVVEKTTTEKVIKKKKQEKNGRPMTTDEPLNQKITINLSETEINNLRSRAGQVPIATFLRDILKKAKVI